MGELSHLYCFIGGLHRSGTSVIARRIATLPGVGGITGAPVPENEGVYLQGAIPHTALSGAPMQFATDPRQHLTEDHPLNRLETRLRLEADWAPWFPRAARWRVEKSPVNLTRMRLLQQLFPLAHCVFVIRHPEAVAAASRKWVDLGESAMIDHWLTAHRRMREDMASLHHAMVLRYEDMVADPVAGLRAVAAFLDLGLPEGATEPLRDGNADYPDAPRLSDAQAEEAARFGYGPDRAVMPWTAPLNHTLRARREAVAAALSPFAPGARAC